MAGFAATPSLAAETRGFAPASQVILAFPVTVQGFAEAHMLSPTTQQ